MTSFRTSFTTSPRHAALIAIGRQLASEYQNELTKPLPRELKRLLVRLVASEFSRRQQGHQLLQAVDAPHVSPTIPGEEPPTRQLERIR